jgi:hypothetical protein
MKAARPVRVNRGTGAQSLGGVTLGSGRFSEQWLQGLIHKHPDCLPVGDIEPAFGELISVGMEIPTRHGPIDNLLITPQGQIVLVEAKLWRNPEARREVVAQALDYATCLFDWDYEELEQGILKATFGDSSRPAKLFDLFADKGGLDQAAFIDAINTNLRKGRVLILVVGDGIRSEARKLATMLQSHAGAHFTFALVELNVFELGGEDDVLIYPRILAQTEMISRGVVEIVGDRVVVSPPKAATMGAVGVAKPSKPQPQSITADEFYDAMAALDPALPDKLRAFLTSIEPLGVETDFQKSLVLRWDPPTGRTINLGYIQRNGEVWTSDVHAHAPRELSHTYIEELARAWGMDVEKVAFGGAWHVRVNGRAPRITLIADKLDRWTAAIDNFTTAVRKQISD